MLERNFITRIWKASTTLDNMHPSCQLSGKARKKNGDKSKQQFQQFISFTFGMNTRARKMVVAVISARFNRAMLVLSNPTSANSDRMITTTQRLEE